MNSKVTFAVVNLPFLKSLIPTNGQLHELGDFTIIGKDKYEILYYIIEL